MSDQPTGPAIDLDAWQAVYAVHAARLTRLATMLVGSANAHDVVADAMLAAITSRSWSTVREPGAYLTRVVVRTAGRHVRRDKARRRREERVAGQPRRSVDELAADRDVAMALDSLSRSQAAVVFLLYWEDLSIPRAAEHLGVSPGTVHRQLDRAKRRLRRVMNDGIDR